MQWVDSTLNFLAPGWVGSIIGLLSLLAAGFIYLLTRQRTGLAFAYCGDRLLGASTANLPAEISVQYKGLPIPRLTRSIVVLWNSGEKTIIKEDIVGADPLRVSIGEEGEILSIALLKVSRPVNEAAIVGSPPRKQDAEITFGYLDAGDGIVIEILHTSENSKPLVLGTFRGLPKGMKDLGRVKRSNQIRKRPFFLSRRILSWATMALGLAMTFAGIFVSAESIDTLITAKPAPNWILMVILGTTYIFFGLWMMYMLRRKHPRSLHVEDLE